MSQISSTQTLISPKCSTPSVRRDGTSSILTICGTRLKRLPIRKLRLDGTSYLLTRSRHRGQPIPVLYTPLCLLTVVDCDVMVLFGDHGHVLGFQQGEKGCHLYLRPGQDTIVQDNGFRAMSLLRGYWAERILNRDGTPRSLPEGTSPEVCRHREMFRRALAIVGF